MKKVLCLFAAILPLVCVAELRSAEPVRVEDVRPNATARADLPAPGRPVVRELGEAPTQREIEEMASRQVLNLVLIAREIRAGHAQQVLERLESGLPADLEEMAHFQDSPMKTACFYSAGKLYTAMKATPTPAVRMAMFKAKVDIPKLISPDCYAFKKCSCFKLWSLEGVDVTKKDPYGWHYLIDSHCGFHWPKIWKYDCGEPVAVDPCNGD